MFTTLTNRAFVATVFSCSLALGGCGTISSIFGSTPAPAPVMAPDQSAPVTETNEYSAHPSHHAMGHDAMAHVQQSLQDKGYYWGKVDGIDGPLTIAAVREFQRDLGTPVTGVVGHHEWSALGL